MFILRWKHSRTNKDMLARYDTYGQAILRVLIVRKVFPGHKFTLNGKEV